MTNAQALLSAEAATNEIAGAVSAEWVAQVTSDFRDAGRRIEGGWPFTVSDARRELSRQLLGRAGLAKAEFDEIARAVYASAKNDWLSVAERARPCPDAA